MNRVRLCVTCIVGVALLSATTALPFTAPTRSLTSREKLQQAIDYASDVIFARVISAELTTWPRDGSNDPAWRLVLEPFQYFKGGLDGDQVEVIFADPNFQPVEGRRDSTARMAGKSTWASVFFLNSYGGTWFAGVGSGGIYDAEPIQAGQGHWKAIADSVSAVVDDMSLEATLARADVVAVVHADVHGKLQAGKVPLVIDELLAGGRPKGAFMVRTIFGTFPRGQHLVCVKRARDRIYEPIPFARTVLSKEEKPGRGVVLGEERLNEVKSILARVRPKNAKSASKP